MTNVERRDGMTKLGAGTFSGECPYCAQGLEMLVIGGWRTRYHKRDGLLLDCRRAPVPTKVRDMAGEPE